MSYEPTTWVTGDIITATKLNNIESGVQSVSSSYTPTTWVTGDIITAVKLNNIEQGIANAGGGGGSSDFSTAQVTVINNSLQNIPIYAPFDTQYGPMGSQTSSPQSNISFDVIIHNNIGTLLYFDYGAITYQTEATGNIEKDNDDFIITGDGTITIS